jgi:serine/threonine protein kinase
VGTVDYIAPEQIEGGDVNARADIYSLGCVLHELVTGRPAYERDSDVAKLWAHVHDPPPSLAGEDSADVRRLDPVLARAMATRPEDRLASAGALAQAARDALSGAPSTVLETAPAPPPPEPPPTAPAAPAPAPREGPPSAPTAPLPQSNPWQAESVPPARQGRSSGTAVAIVIVAALVALGGIVAAVFATGALESDDPPASAGNRDGRDGNSPSKGMKAYATDSYTAEVPRGWRFNEDYVLQDSTSGRERRTTELRRGSAEIIIDTTLDSPGGQGDAKKTARNSHSGRAGEIGYDLIELEPLTVGDHDAYNWIYSADGKYTTVIYFFDGEHGYGIVGTATPGKFDQVRELTERVAASVASR